jgi:hypothetical protein
VLCRECLSRQPLADIAVGGGSGSAIKLARRCRICSRFASFAQPQRWERETGGREKREKEKEKYIKRKEGREGEQEQEREYARTREHAQEKVAGRDREIMCMQAYMCVFGSRCAADTPAGP